MFCNRTYKSTEKLSQPVSAVLRIGSTAILRTCILRTFCMNSVCLSLDYDIVNLQGY